MKVNKILLECQTPVSLILLILHANYCRPKDSNPQPICHVIKRACYVKTIRK